MLPGEALQGEGGIAGVLEADVLLIQDLGDHVHSFFVCAQQKDTRGHNANDARRTVTSEQVTVVRGFALG